MTEGIVNTFIYPSRTSRRPRPCTGSSWAAAGDAGNFVLGNPGGAGLLIAFLLACGLTGLGMMWLLRRSARIAQGTEQCKNILGRVYLPNLVEGVFSEVVCCGAHTALEHRHTPQI